MNPKLNISRVVRSERVGSTEAKPMPMKHRARDVVSRPENSFGTLYWIFVWELFFGTRRNSPPLVNTPSIRETAHIADIPYPKTTKAIMLDKLSDSDFP